VKYPSATEKNLRKFLFHRVMIFIIASLIKNQSWQKEQIKILKTKLLDLTKQKRD